MTTTTNLNLKKPEQSDGINIADINGNMDTLDQQIKGLKDKFDPEGRAKDADRLGGMLPSDLALRDHNHSGVYAPATHSHTPAEAGATPAAHGQDGTIHVTAADKTNWNGKAAGSHVSDTVLHTTQAEKNKWNGGANAWVATSVTMQSSNTLFNLTVPNFVFAENCTVSFKAPTSPNGNSYVCIQFNGTGNVYALRSLQGGVVDSESWVANATVTVTLSTQKFNLGGSGDERNGTAFFKSGGASTPKFPTYTGSHALFGTDRKGYIEIYSSGTLTAQANMNVEAFLVGGGGGGGAGGRTSNYRGGGGGGGGYVKLLTGIALTKDIQYAAVIGAGGNGSQATASANYRGGTGGVTSIFGNSANGGIGGMGAYNTLSVGGDGGSGGGAGGNFSGDEYTNYYGGGNGGYNGSAGNGANGSTWSSGGAGAGVSTIYNEKAYSGGGGGGASSTSTHNGANPFGYGNNGSSNGAAYGTHASAALANTGGGGGGGGINNGYGGTGGSGIIIIRWGY